MSWHHIGSAIKREITVYRLVLQHPETPRLARWLLAFALIYLASPIDLIPDWLPILGQLDDLVIVPYLVRLALRRIPQNIISECRARVNDTN